jgi:hypothetical protein
MQNSYLFDADLKDFHNDSDTGNIPIEAIYQAFKARMEKEKLTDDNNHLLEKLASYAHGTWSGWMKYMFSKTTINTDGTVTIPKWAVDRWTFQIELGYDQLPEEMKKSDRDEANEIIAILESEK